MAIAYGANAGTNDGTTSVSSFTITLNHNIPAGSLIIISVVAINVGDTNDLSSVTDSASNTYVSGGFACDGGQNCLSSVWYCKNSSALSSSQTVTVHFSSALLTGGQAWFGSVDYATGQDTTTPKDVASFSTVAGTVSPWATNSITTTNANDLLWVLFGDGQGETSAIVPGDCNPTTGWTIPSGLTQIGDGMRTAYQVVSATGSYKGGGTDVTGNNGMSVGIIAFKAASGGGNVNGSATLNSASNLLALGSDSAKLGSASDLFPYILTGTSNILALGSDNIVLGSTASLGSLGSDSAKLGAGSSLLVLAGAGATLTDDSILPVLGSAASLGLGADSILEALAGSGLILGAASDLFPTTLTGSSSLLVLGSAGVILGAESIISASESTNVEGAATLLSASSLLGLGSNSTSLLAASAISINGQIYLYASGTLESASSLLAETGGIVLVSAESLLQVIASVHGANVAPFIAVPKEVAVMLLSSLVYNAFNNKQAVFAYIQVASSRSPALPTPNTTITSTQTCTYTSNGAAMTTGNPVTCTVTFPDGTTTNYALGSGIVNSGAGVYTLTYTTKGPGTHKELWSFTDTSTGYVLQSEVLTPVTY